MSTANIEFSALFGGNGIFVEELYARYKDDPGSVDESWRQFFAGLDDEQQAVFDGVQGAPWAPRSTAVIGRDAPEEAPNGKLNGKAAAGLDAAAVQTTAQETARALMLIHAYRTRGHKIADLDPLKLDNKDYHPELDPKTYGFSESDLEKDIFIGGELGLEHAKLKDILAILRQTYCRTIGVEYMHIEFGEQRTWIQEHIENNLGRPPLSDTEKKRTLKDIIEVEAFEQFLHTKYPGAKRFSVQGADAFIAGLEAAILRASDVGVEEIVLGMPHRGRLNVLTTVMGKPYVELLSLFHGNMGIPEGINSSGDVKYHLGASSDRELENGREIHLSLTANPSHLEAVNPVVAGKVRAKQDQKNDADKSQVMGILMHGDAAFAGQGSVAETLSLGELVGYRTGGTLHIIVNNQIGFTTSPRFSRFTPYPSDVAKMVQAPIFHVNGDDPDAVAAICKLAVEFRQQFKRDVVVDIICYRKYGHNESDEPSFTQPKMYRHIRNHASPGEIYAKQLVSEGVVTQGDVDGIFADYKAQFEKDFDAGKSYKPNDADWLEGQWSGFKKPAGDHPQGDTGVALKRLKEIGHALSHVPEDVALNPKIVRQLQAKRAMIDSGKGIDWATAEALAYGSLLEQGFPVRLSGQDCGRGTFSQRHSVLRDQETEARYEPLNHLSQSQAHYEVIDSNLSELAILGFEYGYSLSEPNALTLWEAQFGDFANGAQVIIDQFIASGEVKWLRMSGLVMLLPHGYEGQGPEHSSARLERYLQLCAEDNMQVANCTTPANYFHILRRQLCRDFRKPLVIMTPKSLLRHKRAVSELRDMAKRTQFRRIIPEVDEGLTTDKKIRKVVLCTGKVYYDLVEAREAAGIKDIAILRVEQLYPFPAALIEKELRRYTKADVVWCQEEPKNTGAWSFIRERMEPVMETLDRDPCRIGYAGRAEAASPATGFLTVHNQEQEALVKEALG